MGSFEIPTEKNKFPWDLKNSYGNNFLDFGRGKYSAGYIMKNKFTILR